VLEGLSEQTRPVDLTVAVDTGSKDDSASIVQAVVGEDLLVRADRSTGYGDAVRLGLARLDEHCDAQSSAQASGDRPEWIWLLHDDSRPDPEALEWLLLATQEHPDADVLGPKLREWPSLRRLLEVGLTVSGTGRRETGLERGEYDQGQHDVERTVLAVNTAGMLVRRDVLDRLGGFDPQLPIFGNDLDFGWRAAQAGHRTLVVPQAVVFHAEAAHRGLRRTPLTGRHTHYQERRAALYTQLVNCSGRSLLFRALRLTVGSVLRALGFLLVRSVGEAADELAALGSVLARPGLLLRARRERRALHTADRDEVDALLAPWWLPYRHGLDTMGGIVSAATLQAQDVAERRRLAKAEAEGQVDRASARELHEARDDDELEPDQSWVARFFTSPVALGLTAFVILALIGARDAFGDVAGGALSPAPSGVGDWWRLYGEAHHPLRQGSDVPAPAYLPVLAALGALWGGSASAAVSTVLLLSIPVALLGAWRLVGVSARLLGGSGAPRWLVAWAAATYALVPVTSGAWGDGRLGTVVAAALLPWLARAALGFGDPGADRRWRAGWRTGLLLAVVTAFAPLAWWVALVLAVVLLAVVGRLAPRGLRQWSVTGPPLAALATPVVLLLPWWLPMLLTGPARGVLLDTGRPPAPAMGALDLVTATVSDLGAGPGWGAVLVVLAVAALVPERTRIPVLACWFAAASAVIAAAVLSRTTIPVAETGPGLGVAAVVVVGAAVLAVVLALAPLVGRLPKAGLVGVVIGLLALPVTGLAWFATAAPTAYDEAASDAVPAYMAQSSLLGPAHGALLLRGSVAQGLDYEVRRGDGLTVGEDEIVALTPEDAGLTDVVSRLVSEPTPALVEDLAGRGIEYVVLVGPADSRVAATLDAATGLEQASTTDRSARAWRLTATPVAGEVAGHGSTLRTILLAVQGVALLVLLVLCGPAREDRQ